MGVETVGVIIVYADISQSNTKPFLDALEFHRWNWSLAIFGSFDFQIVGIIHIFLKFNILPGLLVLSR